MKEFYARLSSFERRVFFFFVIVGFIVFHLFVTRPLLKRWDEVNARRDKANKLLKLYNDEIAKSSDYKKKITELQGQGAIVAQEDQGTDFALTIQRQAGASQVNVTHSVQLPGKTNAHFFEKAQSLTVNCGETNLVNFLFSLGEGASLIRVRDMSLRPADPQRTALTASMKLVASYQKKQPAPKPATPAPATAPKTTTPAPAAKPAATTAVKPSTTTKK